MTAARRAILFFALLSLTVCASAVGAATTVKVWTQSPNDKVQPTTAPSLATTVAIEGGRNSVEAHQIIVRASGGAPAGGNNTAHSLTPRPSPVTTGSAVN